jgi:Pyridoxamine 5'-phosphate oxidase
MTAINLDTQDGTPTLDLAMVTERLDRGFDQAPGGGGPNRHSSWLTTVNADGGPHTTGIGALWADGSFWFETGPGTRKARNVARDPRCSLALALQEFDLTVEGRVERVTDPDVVAARAADWAEGGWPCEVDDSGIALTAPFTAPSGGPPPWHVYRIAITSMVALLTVEPGGATRWRF